MGQHAVYSRETERLLVRAMAQLAPVRDSTRAVHRWVASGAAKEPGMAALKEILATLKGLELAAVASVGATGEAWESALNDLRRFNDVDSQIDEDLDAAAFLKGSRAVVGSLIDTMGETQAAFGAGLLDALKKHGGFDPTAVVEFAEALKDDVTGFIPFYTSFSKFLAMTGVGDVDEMWRHLAEPARRRLVVNALERGTFYLDAARDYFFMAWNVIGREIFPEKAMELERMLPHRSPGGLGGGAETE